MHLNSPELAECVYSNRWRTRHAGEKLWLAGGLLLLSIALPPFPVALVVTVLMAAITLGWARVRCGLYLRVLAVPLGFALLSAASLLVSVQINANCVALQFAPSGFNTAAQTFVRALAAVSCLSFLIVTTPLAELLALLRRAGLPAPLCEVMFVMQRFAGLLIETAHRMWLAQAARGGGHSWLSSLRSFSLITTQLFRRVMWQAHACEVGLQIRGGDGELRLLEPLRVTSPIAWGAIGVLHTALLGLGWYAAR